jgi:perosamine synthetase
MWQELPPTAGMPLTVSDLFPSCGADELPAFLASFLNVPSVQMTSSGTAALVIALETLKEESDRKQVIVPGYTCPLVCLAIAQAGLQAVVCDTKEESFDFDLDRLQQCLGPNTLAIICTHLGGLPADLGSAAALAREAGAVVIEDVAQSLGARLGDSALGTIGDIGVFSLTRGKGLTTFYGGFLYASQAELRKKLRATADKAQKRHLFIEWKHCLQLIGYALVYNPVGLAPVYGWSLRWHLKRGERDQAIGDVFDNEPEPLHAIGDYRQKVCAASAKRFPRFLADNRERALSRIKTLAVIPGLRVLNELQPMETIGSWPFLTVVFDRAENCEKVLSLLWTRGLGVTKLFGRAIDEYDYLPEFSAGTAPNAAALAARSLTITNSHMLSDEQFELICGTISACMSQRSSPLNVLAPATL